MRLLHLDQLESGSWRRPVSLDIGEGEIVLLLGRNGAGKTTLLETIAGLQSVRSGRIKVDGFDVTTLDEHGRIAKGIRIALEGRQLFTRLSVRRNLLLGAFGRRQKSHISTDLERVLDLFPDLRPKLGQPAGSLSGGQQTMVNISRALMGRPQLLLLDEPSLGLDPQNTAKLISALHEIQQEGGVAVLVGEQSGALARAFPERVLLMVGGELLFDGTLEDAERRGAVAEVFA